jgi:hypothetical protein
MTELLIILGGGVLLGVLCALLVYSLYRAWRHIRD